MTFAKIFVKILDKPNRGRLLNIVLTIVFLRRGESCRKKPTALLTNLLLYLPLTTGLLELWRQNSG